MDVLLRAAEPRMQAGPALPPITGGTPVTDAFKSLWTTPTHQGDGRDRLLERDRVPSLEETLILGLHATADARAVVTGKDADSENRSPIAAAAIKTAFIGGMVKSGLDLVRLTKKLPEAYRAGNLGLALRQTMLIAPDTRIIDPRAPLKATLESGGRSFTNFDSKAYMGASLLGVGIAALNFSTSIPNLVDAYQKEGPAGFYGTTSGRSGVLQFLGGGMGLAIFGKALLATRGQEMGALQRVVSAARSPLTTSPMVTQLGMAAAFGVMANELGYFDWMNVGEKRPLPTVLLDATHRTPVVNNPELRGVALIAGTAALVVSTAHNLLATPPALSSVPAATTISKGKLLGAAVLVGLLGVQLLGGLDFLNRPAEPLANAS